MAPKLKIAGLYTNSNQHSAIPPGSLAEADNCVIRSKDQLEPRRGMGADSFAIGTTVTQNAIAFYDSGRILQYSEGGTQKLARSTGGAWTAYSGTYIPPDVSLLRMKFAEANQNLYFNTSLGVKAITSLATTPVFAGVPAPADLKGTSLGAETTGLGGAPNSYTIIPVNTAVGYRAVLGIRDVNGNLKLSAPSGRFVVVNPPNVSVAIGGMVRTLTTTVTVTCASHSFRVGTNVIFTEAAEVGPPAFGTGGGTGHTITATTATTFTYSEAGTNGANAATKTFTAGSNFARFDIKFEPGYATVNHFVRLYRTLMVSATSDPGDEMYQVAEYKLASGTLTTCPVSDLTPESSLYSSPLYTNPKTGDGIGAANTQPPFCKDLALWQQRMWFANTSQKQRYTFQILGCGSPDGIQNGDLLAIADLTVYFYTAGGTTSGTHWSSALTTALTPAQNIEVTSQNLVQLINTLWAGGTTSFRAAYISGQGDAPGKILIESTAFGASPFYFGATRPASYSPVPPTAAVVLNTSARVGTTVTVNTGTGHGFATGQVVRLASGIPSASFSVGAKTITVTSATQFTYVDTVSGAASFPANTYLVHAQDQASDNDSKPHGVYYSKAQEPEAVPLLNYVTVGAKNKEIRRIVPLREKLFVFKDDGLYTISGTAPFLQVDALDTTLRLVAPDSAVVLGNQIYCLTNQGVVTVSDSGVGVISFPIEQDILTRVALATNVRKSAFGVSYDSDRMYILGIPANGSATSCNKQWVYNYVTKAWTTWSLDVRHGGVDPLSDKLVWNGTSDYVVVERKANTAADYYGDTSTSATVTMTGLEANLSTVPPVVSVGDALITATGSYVTAAGTPPNEAILFSAIADGAGTYYARYVCTVKFAKDALAMPGLTKQFREICLHFSSQSIRNLTATIGTEYASATTAIVGSTSGVFPITVSSSAKNFRYLVPLTCQRGTEIQVGFTTAEAGSYWRLDGYSIEVDEGSHRVNR